MREGIERERIFVTGNPIFEVLERLSRARSRPAACSSGSVSSARGYFLVTLHRAENVDDPRTSRAAPVRTGARSPKRTACR